MKQSIDMMPKDVRKEMLRQRKEEKDTEQTQQVMIKLSLQCLRVRFVTSRAADNVP